MPFPFKLPTTSTLDYSVFLQCESHPSLLLTATTYRSVMRSTLKKHKRLSPKDQTSNLSIVLAAINDYVPFLFAIDSALSGKQVGDEEVHIILEEEIEVEWRAALAARTAGRELARTKGKGLDFELCFILHTLACTLSLLARDHLHTLYAGHAPTAEQRTTVIQTASVYLLQANSIHGYLSNRASEVRFPPEAVDVLASTQSALASLALAEANLLAILKDDTYPSIVAQDRNKDDMEWMIKAPDIPKVRAHLFARLALQSGEYAGKAYSLLSVVRGIDEVFIKYTRNLQRASRAKACRFCGLDAELGGETAKGIAWLIGGKKELGLKVDDEAGAKLKGFSKLRKGWSEKREDKKMESGGDWGINAGMQDEGRVIEMLEKKWNRSNNIINTQAIPPSDPLIASMPSGRDWHKPKAFVAPTISADILSRMRAPVDRSKQRLSGSDSDDDSEREGPVPGAFPSTSGDGEHVYA